MLSADDQTPATQAARIRRGFFRVGMILAVPIALVVGAAVCVIAYEKADSAQGRYDALACLKTKASLPAETYDRQQVDTDGVGCGYYRITFVEARAPLPARPSWVSDFLAIAVPWSAAALAAGALALGCFYAIGWAISGFWRD